MSACLFCSRQGCIESTFQSSSKPETLLLTTARVESWLNNYTTLQMLFENVH